MVFAYSLPLCLLLPDDNYLVKLDIDDIVTLKLTKTIPQHYDERLPYRGLSEKELNEMSQIKIHFPLQNKTIEIDREFKRNYRLWCGYTIYKKEWRNSNPTIK